MFACKRTHCIATLNRVHKFDVVSLEHYVGGVVRGTIRPGRRVALQATHCLATTRPINDVATKRELVRDAGKLFGCNLFT